MSNHRNMAADLHRAFLATRFTVELAGAVHEIRVGKPLPVPLKEFLAQVGETDWVYVTAWNPNSIPLPLEENRARQDAMRRELERHHSILTGIGIGSDCWSEESIFVAGVDFELGARIGRTYGQLSVVAGKSDDIARLVYCDSGEVHPQEE